MENITFCKNSILWYDIWKGTLKLYTVTAFHTESQLFCFGTFVPCGLVIWHLSGSGHLVGIVEWK